MGRSELVDVSAISDQIPDVVHLVGAVVVNHYELWGPRRKRRKQQQSQKTVKHVVVHGTWVDHECNNAQHR